MGLGVPDEQQCKTSGTNEGTSTKPGFPNVPTYDFESENETWGDNEDTNDDDIMMTVKVMMIRQAVMMMDVDVRSLGAEQEQENIGDEETTDKTDSTKQSSSVSSEFASKFLILENVPPAVDEVASMMNVKNRQKESSTQAPTLFTVLETAIPDTYTPHATTLPPTISMISPPP
nr:hypothetical protein [Tanacetum cinerariifolium]